jgi:hypothetical protein
MVRGQGPEGRDAHGVHGIDQVNKAAAHAKQAPAPKAAARKRPDPEQIIPLETEDFRDF